MTTEKTFDPTKPVQTRNGLKTRIICTDKLGRDNGYTIAALVLLDDGNESLRQYKSNGRFFGGESEHDLVNVPERKSVFMNVYLNYVPRVTVHKTLQKARDCNPGDYGERLGTVEVIREEDEVVDVVFHKAQE